MVCDRVREQVSLQLDGELSELEARMLESHVSRCPECAAYREGVRSFTRMLREAPLEMPERRVVVRRRRHMSMGRIQAGVAAAFALAALGLGTQLQFRPDLPATRPVGTVTSYPTDAEVANEMALLRLARYGHPSNRSAAHF